MHGESRAMALEASQSAPVAATVLLIEPA
jgi:hypothetical protein